MPSLTESLRASSKGTPPPRMSLEYDEANDAWTLRHTERHIRTLEDIEVWRTEILQAFRKFGGEKVYLLIDAAGFHLDSSVAEAYGRFAKEVTRKHALAVMRYGAVDGWTETQVRLQAVIQHYPSNFFADRKAALEALAKIRRQEQGQTAPGPAAAP